MDVNQWNKNLATLNAAVKVGWLDPEVAEALRQTLGTLTEAHDLIKRQQEVIEKLQKSAEMWRENAKRADKLLELFGTTDERQRELARIYRQSLAGN
jgi:hypothetical protein